MSCRRITHNSCIEIVIKSLFIEFSQLAIWQNIQKVVPLKPLHSYNIMNEQKKSSSIVIRNAFNITFSDDTTAIDLESSAYFGNARYLTIPKNVKYIDPKVLDYWTTITTIAVDKDNLSFKVIDNVLFSHDGKTLIFYPPLRPDTRYDVPVGVETIECYSFSNCLLGTINISDSVKSIESAAFHHCLRLKNVVVNPKNESYESANGVLYSKDYRSLIYYPSNKENIMYDVPEETNKICEEAFQSCQHLENVTISENVTECDKSLFANCRSLLAINIKGSISEIGDAFFANCKRLQTITFSQKVTKISENAFNSCLKLKTIIVDKLNPNYKTNDGILYYRNPDSLLFIPLANPKADVSLRYRMKSLTPISEQETVTITLNFTNQKYICEKCKKIIIPDSIISIEVKKLTNFTQLEEISVHSGNLRYASANGMLFTKNFDRLLFNPPCNKTKILELPNGLISLKVIRRPIDKYALKMIKVIVIPESIKEIDTDFFDFFCGLKSICVDEKNEKYASLKGMLFTKNYDKLIYKAFWNKETVLDLPNGTTSFTATRSYYCYDFEKFVIPKTLINIDVKIVNCFLNLKEYIVNHENKNFTSVNGILYSKDLRKLIGIPRKHPTKRIRIPYGQDRINSHQFSFCEKLEFIGIPNTVKTIGGFAFKRCLSLQSIDIPQSVTSIDYSLFAETKNLQTITIQGQISDLKSKIPNLCIPENAEVSVLSPNLE